VSSLFLYSGWLGSIPKIELVTEPVFSFQFSGVISQLMMHHLSPRQHLQEQILQTVAQRGTVLRGAAQHPSRICFNRLIFLSTLSYIILFPELACNFSALTHTEKSDYPSSYL
jgi:hypothetical protein